MSTKHSRTNLDATPAIVLTAALTLTPCGSDTEGSQQSGVDPDVDIAQDYPDDTEEVNIDGGLDLEQPAAWIIDEGDGDAVKNGDMIQLLTASVDVESQEVRAQDFNAGGSVT